MTQTAQPTPPRRKRLPWYVAALFLCALGFTAVGVVEAAFIAYDLATGRTLTYQRTPDLSFGVRSWSLHHALRPGFSVEHLHTNSFGLRSPEVAVPKPPGTYRILLLGDSFTFGYLASDPELFSRHLEAQLRERHGNAIEVVNAGVLSYCPLLEYLQYKQHLHILQPDLVILNFDMSDVQDHMDYSRDAAFAADGTPLFVTEPSLKRAATPWPQLLSTEWLWRHAVALRRRIDASREGVPFARDADRYLWTLDNGPDWSRQVNEALQPVARLHDLLASFETPLVLATYPQAWQVSARATPWEPIRNQFQIAPGSVHLNDRPFRMLEAFAAAEGIPFVNATAAFRKDADSARLYLERDFHFTERGHKLYANVLAAAIDERLPVTPAPATTPSR